MIFNNDLSMFNENSEICNFAHDNSLYSCGMELSGILDTLFIRTSKILMRLNVIFHLQSVFFVLIYRTPLLSYMYNTSRSFRIFTRLRYVVFELRYVVL